jgi:Domain of unknown function (DUF4157)
MSAGAAPQPAKTRRLTQGEIALAQAAFGEALAYERVRLSDGPGGNFAAHIAFARGNPAITLGAAIYFKRGYCADFSAPGEDAKSFLHEMTHVWQYRRLGQAAFYARYGKELAAAGFKPNRMYDYAPGETEFAGASLEAQAAMVADYGDALWSGHPAAIARFAKNLAGSGLYRL